MFRVLKTHFNRVFTVVVIVVFFFRGGVCDMKSRCFNSSNFYISEAVVIVILMLKSQYK